MRLVRSIPRDLRNIIAVVFLERIMSLCKNKIGIKLYCLPQKLYCEHVIFFFVDVLVNLWRFTRVNSAFALNDLIREEDSIIDMALLTASVTKRSLGQGFVKQLNYTEKIRSTNKRQ